MQTKDQTTEPNEKRVKEAVESLRQMCSKWFGDEAILRARNYRGMRIRKGEPLHENNIEEIEKRLDFVEGVQDRIDEFPPHTFTEEQKATLLEHYMRLSVEYWRLTKWRWPLGGLDSDQFYTPKIFVDAARKAMGTIDVDPASNEHANKHYVHAPLFYDINTNGLKHPWKGNVWLNPPYSGGIVSKFIFKLIKEHKAGRCKQCVLLWIFSPGGTKAANAIRDVAKAVCIVDQKIKFRRPDGKTQQIPFQSALYYLGPNVAGFRKEFEQWGKIAKLSGNPSPPGTKQAHTAKTTSRPPSLSKPVVKRGDIVMWEGRRCEVIDIDKGEVSVKTPDGNIWRMEGKFDWAK